jgi:hypothetical protein
MERSQLELRLAPPLTLRYRVDLELTDDQLTFAANSHGQWWGSARCHGERTASDPGRLLHCLPALTGIRAGKQRQLRQDAVDPCADQMQLTDHNPPTRKRGRTTYTRSPGPVIEHPLCPFWLDGPDATRSNEPAAELVRRPRQRHPDEAHAGPGIRQAVPRTACTSSAAKRCDQDDARPAAIQRRARPDLACPRQESNLRTRFRKPLLYPLSYGGVQIKYRRG